MMMDQVPSILPITPAASEARRRFLAACGTAAIAMPPAISLMLGGDRNYASATSAGSIARLSKLAVRPFDRHPWLA
ncbi:MAG: hypothetical protein IT563_07000 [Alphaproteobacteria bacterium]|nr:hypothetical protein [Alphaproteobacteria bacterium]